MNDQELESRLKGIEETLEALRIFLKMPGPLPQQLPPPLLEEGGWSGRTSSTLMKKPIMYLYNFTGDTLNCNVDFKSNIIADSVPEIRKDNKIVFSLDSDSYINEKYAYLYYEFDITGNEPKSSSYTFVKNNKNLDYDLERLANCLGFNPDEAKDFVCYWGLELKRLDTPFFKCEIFDETKLDKLFPIEIDPAPAWIARRYVKFLPVDKIGKGNITAEQFRPRARTGSLRIFEWGGFIAGSGKIK